MAHARHNRCRTNLRILHPSLRRRVTSVNRSFPTSVTVGYQPLLNSCPRATEHVAGMVMARWLHASHSAGTCSRQAREPATKDKRRVLTVQARMLKHTAVR